LPTPVDPDFLRRAAGMGCWVPVRR